MIGPRTNSALLRIRLIIASRTPRSPFGRIMTKRRLSLIAAFGLLSVSLAGLLFSLSASVFAQNQYPLMDDVAHKIVQKYQSSTCEQLWVRKSAHAPPTMEETRVVTFLHDDADMRTAFMKIVAPPVVTKLFDCGLIP
jgi:hypothetical protein